MGTAHQYLVLLVQINTHMPCMRPTPRSPWRAYSQGNPAPGAMDAALSLVLPIIEGELFGEVADAKEAGALAGSYKEAARARGCDTYQLCAAMITVERSVATLLEPVRHVSGAVVRVVNCDWPVHASLQHTT